MTENKPRRKKEVVSTGDGPVVSIEVGSPPVQYPEPHSEKKEVVDTTAVVKGEVVERQQEVVKTEEEDPGVKAFEVLRQLLKDKSTAGVVTKAIAEFQIRSYHAYKQRTGKRRLNEKETFIVISLGAANFVNHIRG